MTTMRQDANKVNVPDIETAADIHGFMANEAAVQRQQADEYRNRHFMALGAAQALEQAAALFGAKAEAEDNAMEPASGKVDLDDVKPMQE